MIAAGDISAADGIIARAVTNPPVINGILDDKCWSGAPAITEFVSLKEPDIKREHRVWTAHDDAWLYFALDVRHPAPKRLTLNCREHDGDLSNDDSVELFLDPGTNGERYFHYILSAANIKAEQRADRGGLRDRAWNGPWRSAARTADAGWTAESAIPLSLLVSYGAPDRVRVNVCLNVLEPVFDPQGIQVDLRREWLTWKPLAGGFHEPDRFGRLALPDLAGMAVKPPFLPALAGRPAVGSYAADNGRLHYPAAVDVANHSTVQGAVRVAVLDRPRSGGVNRVERMVELEPMAQTGVVIDVPVSNPASRSVEVLLEDPASGEIWQRDMINDTSALTLLSVYPERSYFTDEPEVAVWCELGLPAGALQGLRAELKDEAGQRLALTDKVTPRTCLSIERARLPAGAHNLRAAICRADGGMLFEKEARVVCRAPQPGHEVKIDHVRRVILRNGQPFFPFGLIFSSTNRADMREVAEAGHNTLMWWSKIKPEDGRRYLDLAQEFNLLMWMPVEDFCRKVPLTRIKVALIQGGQPPYQYYIKDFINTPPEDKRALRDFSPAEKSSIFAAAYAKALPEMLDGIRNIQGCSNLLAYSNFDEAFGARYFDQWVQGLDLYNRVYAEDGYHPMHALAGAEEFDFCDMIGPDPYWIPGHPGEAGSPLHVVNMHYMFEQRARAGRKPVVHVPVGERWSGMHQRYLTPAEQFCQTYLLLIHGAKGLFYFCYPFTHQSSFASLAELARQIRTLGPAAVAPEVPQEIQYNPGEMDYANKKYPDIHARLLADPAGGLILLAANCRPYTVDAGFAMPMLDADCAVSRMFTPGNSKKYPVSNGSFKDRFEAYGVRAYKISSQHEAPGIINLTLSMAAHPEEAAPEYTVPAIPRSGRMDMKNILPNPSFEQAALPGLPDYYRAIWMPGPRIGQPGSLWGLDEVNPWHGKVSMRLAGRGFFECYIAPGVKKPQAMVFSAYMRADRDGVEVEFNPGALGEPRKFKLTDAWARYSAPLAAAPTSGRLDMYNTIRLYAPRDAALWVDAVQLEAGDTPTEFEE